MPGGGGFDLFTKQEQKQIELRGASSRGYSSTSLGHVKVGVFQIFGEFRVRWPAHHGNRRWKIGFPIVESGQRTTFLVVSPRQIDGGARRVNLAT